MMDVLDENQVHAKYKETTNKQLPLVDTMVHLHAQSAWKFKRMGLSCKVNNIKSMKMRTWLIFVCTWSAILSRDYLIGELFTDARD